MNPRLMGYLTLILLVVVTAPYWLRTLNSWTFKTKDKRFLNFLKFLRKLHKPLGLVIVALALWHGYDMFRLNLHTGLVAFAAFVLTGILGGMHYRLKNKQIFKAHKIMAFISVLLVALHLFWPSALRQVFGI